MAKIVRTEAWATVSSTKGTALPTKQKIIQVRSLYDDQNQITSTNQSINLIKIH